MRMISALVAMLLFVGAAAAANVPALKGPVNDYAGVLEEADVKRLNDMLLEREKETGTQIVLLTVPSLEGDTVESFGVKVFKAWRLGQEKKDNGVLLLFALKERKLRIEVGKGLEDVLTDLRAGEILREKVAPLTKKHRYADGFFEGLVAIDQAARGQFAPLAAPAPSVVPTWVVVLIVIVLVGLALFLIYLVVCAKTPLLGGGYGSSSGGDWGWSGSGGSYGGGGGDCGGGGASSDG